MLIIPIALILAILYVGIDRKIGARMQNRIGPPIWQPLYDILKLIQKEDLAPKGVSRFFTIFPIFALASTSLILFILPTGTQIMGFDWDALLLVYLFVMSTSFLVLSGFSSNNPFASVGSWRKLLLLLGTEVPFLVIIATLIIQSNSFSLQAISSTPRLLPFSFIAFLLTAQAKLMRAPFNIPDAETEIVAGITTEYSGKNLAILEFDHYLELIILLALGATLFLSFTTWPIFILQTFLLLLALITIRFITARLRIEQSIRFLWFFVAPLAIIDLLRVMLL